MFGYDAFRLTKAIFVNLLLFTVVLLTYGKFRFRPFCQTDSVPFIRLRGNGEIRMGKIKARSGLRMFADGGIIHIGDGVFFNSNCSLSAKSKISIGADTLIGENVSIYDHNHLFAAESGVNAAGFVQAPVSIGCRCWLGSNVVVLKGVSICDNVAVAAGSVVSRSIYESGVYAAIGTRELALISKTVN